MTVTVNDGLSLRMLASAGVIADKATMDVEELTIAIDRLCPGAPDWTGPAVFVDLSREADGVEGELVLPHVPVIGVGSADHPLAATLDLLVSSAQEATALLERIEAAPLAARTIAQLLRILPDLSPEAGITAESLAYATLQGSEEHRAWIANQPVMDSDDREEGRVELVRDGNRLIITLDRANAGNAIDRSMRDGLHDALQLAAIDPEIEAVLLRGRGKAFSLGAELSEFGTTTDPATAHDIRCRTLPARQAIRCADKLEVHVHGACVGAGLEIAAFARHLTAGPKAWFQLPELAMGILPGAGGCVSLTRRIGRQKTALMILSGRRLSARAALDWGLVDAIVDDPA